MTNEKITEITTGIDIVKTKALELGDKVELRTGFSPIMVITYIYCASENCPKRFKCASSSKNIAVCSWFEHDAAKDIWEYRQTKLAIETLRRVQ